MSYYYFFFLAGEEVGSDTVVHIKISCSDWVCKFFSIYLMVSASSNGTYWRFTRDLKVSLDFCWNCTWRLGCLFLQDLPAVPG